MPGHSYNGSDKHTFQERGRSTVSLVSAVSYSRAKRAGPGSQGHLHVSCSVSIAHKQFRREKVCSFDYNAVQMQCYYYRLYAAQHYHSVR